MNNEKISVIIPVYNVEKYIGKCINSVLLQTYDNFEVILINDGSTDNSGHICDMFKNKDKRVKVFHQKNCGLSCARNRGLDESLGKYVTFIDSDDWVSEFYLEQLYTLMKENNSNITVGNFEKVCDEEFVINTESVANINLNKNEALIALTSNLYDQLVISCGKLFDKSIFKTLRFPLNKIHEDEFVAHYIFANSDKTTVTSEKLYFYRQHNESITGKGFNIANRLHAIEAFKERGILYKELNLKEGEKLLNRMLFFYLRETLMQVRKNKLTYLPEYFTIQNEQLNVRKILDTFKFDLKFNIFYKMYYLLGMKI